MSRRRRVGAGRAPSRETVALPLQLHHPAYELAREAVTGTGPVRKVVPSETTLAAITASDRAAEASLLGLVAAVAVAVRRLARVEGRPPEAVLSDVWRAFVAGED